MSEESDLIPRVRRLVEVFNETGLVRLRITGEDEDAIELRRSIRPAARREGGASTNGAVPAEHPVVRNVDVIKSDLVGIAHLGKPLPAEGAQLEGDRELAFVEALGIRNPVRSRGGGRLVSVLVADGSPVEYGQPLFEIERV